MSRAYSFLTIKSVSDGERVIEGTASTGEIDRMGDIVEPRGARYKLPLPLLLDHNHSDAVGEVEWAQASNDGIAFRARIAKIDAPGAAKDLVDKAWALARSGLRKAVSIGFRPIESEALPSGGWRFKSWDWYELSLVSVPANASATIAQVKAFAERNKPSRVVKLGTSPIITRTPARVVRLDSPVVSAMAEEAATNANPLDPESRKAMGPQVSALFQIVRAGAHMTDAQIARLDERIDDLSGGKKHLANASEPSLQQAFDDGFEAVKGYVDRSFAKVHRRIDQIESKG